MNLLELMKNTFVDGVGYVIGQDNFDKFSESNVIIPRGENRHPYADLLHEWIEGATLQYKLDSGWVDYREFSMPNQEHRIKPSEPIYEWQWKYKQSNTTMWQGFTGYMTDIEFNIGSVSNTPMTYERDESTKRELK